MAAKKKETKGKSSTSTSSPVYETRKGYRVDTGATQGPSRPSASNKRNQRRNRSVEERATRGAKAVKLQAERKYKQAKKGAAGMYESGKAKSMGMYDSVKGSKFGKHVGANKGRYIAGGAALGVGAIGVAAYKRRQARKRQEAAARR